MKPPSNPPLQTLAVLLTGLTGSFLAAQPAPPPGGDPFPVTIQIDATKTKGELHPIWRFFGADEPNYTYMKDGRNLMGELGQLSPGNVFFRNHNLLTSGNGVPLPKWGSTNAYTEDAQGNPVYDWTILDKIFDNYKASGVRPYVQIGFMPKALSTHPDPYENHYGRGQMEGKDFKAGWSCPPKDYKKWGELVYQWARHEGERYGQDEAASWDWEVWNEPAGYFSGTQADFFKLYDYSVDAVRRALPKAKVGGIETAGGPGGPWLKNFLEHCRSGANAATGKTGAPLDFISFHAKGSPRFVDGHVEMGMANELKNMNDAFAVIAGFPGYRQLPVVVGEADPDGCAACIEPRLGYRSGTLYSSYTAATFARAIDLADQHGVNLDGLLTWAFEFEGEPYFAGHRVLSTNGVDLPILNLFRMFSKMGGQRLAVTSTADAGVTSIIKNGVRGSPDVDALTGLEPKKLSIMVWNYHDDDVPGPSAAVDLQLSGLPVDSGNARLTEYRIDHDHSNAFIAWQKLGSPQQPTPDQVAQLEKAGQLALMDDPGFVPIQGGKTSIKITLPRQAVSLLVLEWN
jgi:xylan 1,4-beta-xylosidase